MATAISNEQILPLTNGQVRYLWRNRQRGDQLRCSWQEVFEFLNRFVRHILPDQFVRVRQYELLANRGKTERLNYCRELLRETARKTC